MPLTLAVSWFEQKAVAILLTLLNLGVKNITLGPNLPVRHMPKSTLTHFIAPQFAQAFVGPETTSFLVSALGLRKTGADVHEDLALFVGKK